MSAATHLHVRAIRQSSRLRLVHKLPEPYAKAAPEGGHHETDTSSIRHPRGADSAYRLAIAAAAQLLGRAAEVVDAARIPDGFSLDAYSAAFLAASVHRQQHEKEMLEFVKRHIDELDRMPTAFLSVSLSEAGAEDPKAPLKRRAQAVLDVRRMIEGSLVETGWRPTEVRAVAGALLYSKYNFLLRFIMKRIARRAGGDTDSSRDYEYTDWAAVDALVEKLAPTS